MECFVDLAKFFEKNPAVLARFVKSRNSNRISASTVSHTRAQNPCRYPSGSRASRLELARKPFTGALLASSGGRLLFSGGAACVGSRAAAQTGRPLRAATLWLATIWFLPVAGPDSVSRARIQPHPAVTPFRWGEPVEAFALFRSILGESRSSEVEHLKMLAGVIGRVVARPLTTGNEVQPLLNGDEAFPAMVSAIEAAKTSVSLATYIFDADTSGERFVAALGDAVKRGVMVRVLVDAAGSRYSWPSIFKKLNQAQVPSAKFLPSSLLKPWRVATINLRNHRKILVIDGETAPPRLPGGMNMAPAQGNVLARNPKHPVQDLHFRLRGPIVGTLQEVFANDWMFTTGEALPKVPWFPELKECGKIIARTITDGPDADYDKLRWTLIAALGRSAKVGADCNAVFFTGRDPDQGAESRGLAWRSR